MTGRPRLLPRLVAPFVAVFLGALVARAVLAAPAPAETTTVVLLGTGTPNPDPKAQGPALTERSVVALPRGKQLDPEHALDQFLAVWSPRLILTGSSDVARVLAKESAYQPAVRSAHIYVLERTTPPPR